MQHDLEKERVSPSIQSFTDDSTDHELPHPTVIAPESRYQRWTKRIKGLETRGIEPIPIEERVKADTRTTFHMFLMWLSMGMALNNMVVGSMGTLVMHLSFQDAALCAIFGNLLGGLAVGYMSTFGPQSGNRTLVCASFCDPLSCLLDFNSSFECHEDERWLTNPSMLDCGEIFYGVLPEQDMLCVKCVDQLGVWDDQRDGRRPNTFQDIGWVCISRRWNRHRRHGKSGNGNVWQCHFPVL